MNTKPTAIQKEMIIALKNALVSLESKNNYSLSPPITEQIEALQNDLDQHNYNKIDEKIYGLIDQDHILNQAYHNAYQEITQNYSSKTKDKIAIDGTILLTPPVTNIRERYPSKINRKALFILQELETYPLTLQDLKYRLELPSWEVYQLVKKLWNDRKINKVSGNIWYSVFPITKPGTLDIEEDDSETYFTVTSLGEMDLRRFSNSR